jgi:hypothetical protein
MAKKIFTSLLAIVLVACLAVVAAAAPATPNVKSAEACNAIPVTYSINGTGYVALPGKLATTPVTYYVDPNYAPKGVVPEIQAAFEAWDNVTATDLFNPAVINKRVNPSTSRPDGKNTVTFRRILDSTAVAVALLWVSDTDGDGVWDQGEPISEFDVIFNLFISGLSIPMMRVLSWHV